MTDQAQKIYQLIIDAGGSKAGADLFKRAADQISEASAKAAAAGKPLTDNVAAAEKAYAGLVTKIDPVSTAQTRMAQQIDVVQRAFAAQKISVDVAATRLQQIAVRYDQTIARAGAFNQGVTTAAGGMAKYGNAIQQAGFQVGDFAVQVASGGGVLRPFIQQGTQLISMFGPWGAVIGAAGAAIGALAPMLLNWARAADTATVSQETLNKTLKDMDAIQKQIEGNTQRNQRSLQAQLNNDLAVVQKAYDQIKKQIDATPKNVAAVDVMGNQGGGEERNPLWDALNKQLIEAEANLLKAKEAAGQFGDAFAKSGQDADSGAASTAKSIREVTDALNEQLRIARLSKQEGDADKIVDQALSQIGFTRASAPQDLIDKWTAIAAAQVAATKANKDATAAQQRSVENMKAVSGVLATLQKQYDDLNKAPLDQRVTDLFAGKAPTDADIAKAKEMLRLIDQAKQDKAEDKAFNSEIDQDIADLTRQAQEQSRWWQTSLASQKDSVGLLQTQLELGGANDNQIQLAMAHAKALQEVHAQIGNVLDDNARKYIENADNIAQMNQQLAKQRAVAQELPNFFDQMTDRIGEATTQLAVQGDQWGSLKSIAMGALSEIEQELLKLSIINPLKNWIEGGNSNPTGGDFLSSLFGLFGGGSGYSGAELGGSGSSYGGGGGGFLSGLLSFLPSIFAKGGVMTSDGPMPLRRYAAGGVATSPQVAMFGEGSRPEAYVPLLDGRSIPVTMQGQGKAANSNASTAVYHTFAPVTEFNVTGGIDKNTEAAMHRVAHAHAKAVMDEYKAAIDSGGFEAKRSGRRR
jgi:uncharacterized protein YukE